MNEEEISGDDQKQSLPLIAAYAFGASHGLENEVAAIRHIPGKSSLRRGYIVDLFERHSIFEEFIDKHWKNARSKDGESRIKRYKRWFEEHKDGGPDGPEGPEEEEEQKFAAEDDLRDFLAEHPGCIEQGLEVYRNGERDGVEFVIDDGRIDILAVDRQKKFVVIELKVGRGRNKTVGQLLYYMGWVDKHLGSEPCRGMIIAKEIADDLRIAVERVPGVSLHQYKLSVTLQQVSPPAK